ncbi:MAG: cytochrome c biogenesis protein CcsA [Candidatus Binatia bacterium]
MELVLLHVATLLYLAPTVLAVAGLWGRGPVPRRALPAFLWAAAACHAVSIGLRSLAVRHLAVTTFPESLSFLALVIVGMYLLLQLRRNLGALGAVVSPLAFGLTLAADVAHTKAQPLPPELQSVWLPAHVMLAVLGDAVFALAFSASLLYLLQERRLKAHRRGFWRHLPSLETLDRLNYQCLVWGLVLLTLGIATGIIWAHEAWEKMFWASDPKLVFSLVTWAIYVLLLQGRLTAGWRGRWAAELTIAGFAVIVLSLVGVNVLAIGLHGKAF